MLRTTLATLFMTAALSGIPPSLLAQTPKPAATPQVEERDARETRERLREILSQYPPSVGQVLRVDPSLISKPDYLAPYPTLAAFLGQHAEVAHNPAFFFGDLRFDSGDGPHRQALNVVQSVLEGLTVLTGLLGFFTLVGWLARTIIHHRAWLRASKVQAEAHSKLVDRLTSNEDLIAYVQSPAGQRAMGSSVSGRPVLEFAAHAATGAPLNRILWSVQVGIVLAVLGIGLWLAKSSVIDEAAEAIHVIAVLIIALGVGFVLSSLVAYVLSRELGLIPESPSTHA